MFPTRLATAALALAMLLPLTARAELEEIVVTATKREASLQEIPLAVTALSAEQIERAGVKDLRDLGTLSASFHMNSSQTESQGSTLRVRGVGTTGNNIGLESAVGVFLDGVYLSRPGVALGDLVDVEQIEVLRGPQGTLFGRNTSAGALTIRTRKPNLEAPERWADLSVGNFAAWNFKMGGSAPVLDGKAGLRFSIALREQDGFLDSPQTGAESRDRDRYSLRGQFYWELEEGLDLRVIVDYADADEHCCDAVVVKEADAAIVSAYNALPGLEEENGGVTEYGNRAVEQRLSNASQFANPFEQAGLSVEVNWEVGPGTLTWLGAYRDFSADSVQDSDFAAVEAWELGLGYDDITTHTHEVRYQSETDRLDWMIGAYFSDEDIEERARLGLGEDFADYISGTFNGLARAALFPTGLAPFILDAEGNDLFAESFADNLYRQQSTSWSVFTHNVFHVSDTLDFVFGLRWIDEEKDGSFEQLGANSPACDNIIAGAAALPAALSPAIIGFSCFPFAVAVVDSPLVVGGQQNPDPRPREFSGTYEDDELAYTLKLAWAATDYANAYASFTHGYKAGGFNLDATAAVRGSDPRFDAELVDAFEVGVKSELFESRLRLNVALFLQNMEDFQVLEFTGVQFTTFNVPKAESSGFEIEAFLSPAEGVDMSFGLTYADANYPGDCAGATTANSITALCGDSLTNAPLWVGTAGLNWEFGHAQNGDHHYFVNAGLRYESHRRTSTQWRTSTDPDNDAYNIPAAFDIQSSNVKVNLRAGVRTAGNVSFEVWASNLFDEHTRHVTFNLPLRGASTLGARGAFLDPPRTFGATVRLNW